MITKKCSQFLSTKPLNSVFMCITRKRLGWQFLQRLVYERFLRRITSIIHQDSTQNPSSFLARSMWDCGEPDWSAAPVLSLCWITVRDFANGHGQSSCRWGMAARLRELPHELEVLCGNGEGQPQLAINMLHSHTQQIQNCELPR